ncbi:MAG: DUF3073 domain-containing protein [Trueperella sp.]|nr:DUF3073 domain-containing protein [Trueperella sp.]
MGRGRQRAKQRKVARNLKYFSPETDYAALERELAVRNSEPEDDDATEDQDSWDEYDPESYKSYDIPPAIEDWD